MTNLTSSLYDQLNLNPASKHNLEKLEIDLVAQIKKDASRDDILAQIRGFCRGNSGEGFYDPHGRIQHLVYNWYAKITGPSIEEQALMSTFSKVYTSDGVHDCIQNMLNQEKTKLATKWLLSLARLDVKEMDKHLSQVRSF